MTNNRVDLLYFEWDGVSSEKYKLYITNGGGGISLPSTPDFKDTVLMPQGQNVSYYAGTSFTQTSFTIAVAAIKITLLQYKEILDWLNVKKVSTLILDTNKEFYSNVKITNITESLWHPYYDEVTDSYLLEFSITFSTVGDYAKQSNKQYLYDLDVDYYDKQGLRETDPRYISKLDPYYSLPIMLYDGVTNKNNEVIEEGKYTVTTRNVKILNPMGADLFINGVIEGVSSVKILDNNATRYNYDFKKFEVYTEGAPAPGTSEPRPPWKPLNIDFKGQYGFAINSVTNSLVELSVNEFIDAEVAYDMKWNVDYTVRLAEQDIENNGAWIIAPSTIKRYDVVLKFYGSMQSDKTMKYYINYIFPYTDSFLNKHLSNDNEYLRFLKIEDNIPLFLGSGLLVTNNNIGTFEISREMYMMYTQGSTITQQNGQVIFITYSNARIITSLSGTGDTKIFHMPMLKGLSGFTKNGNTVSDQLYYNQSSKQWETKRNWNNFIVNDEYLKNARLDLFVWDLPMNPTGSVLSSSTVAASSVETVALNYYFNQDYVNKYIADMYAGKAPGQVVISFPLLSNSSPIGARPDEQWAYCNMLEHLNHADITTTYKEGFFFLQTPQGTRVCLRLNKTRINYSTYDKFSITSAQEFLNRNVLIIYYRTATEYINKVLPDSYQELLEYADRNATINGVTTITSANGTSIPAFNNPLRFENRGDDGSFELALKKSIAKLHTRLRTNI